MSSITREALIEKLCELEPRETVEPLVNRAVETLGWEAKAELTGLEVIKLGTLMAELAREDLSHSENPADRKAASEMKPIVDGLAGEVVPMLNSIQAEKRP